MDVQTYMHGVGRAARAASRLIARADTATKNRTLLAIAQTIEHFATSPGDGVGMLALFDSVIEQVRMQDGQTLAIPEGAVIDTGKQMVVYRESAPGVFDGVEVQRYCPISGSPLGTMGTPDKVVLNGQPVFLCCSGCEEQAKSEPAKTLTKVEGFRRGRKPEGKQ